MYRLLQTVWTTLLAVVLVVGATTSVGVGTASGDLHASAAPSALAQVVAPDAVADAASNSAVTALLDDPRGLVRALRATPPAVPVADVAPEPEPAPAPAPKPAPKPAPAVQPATDGTPHHLAVGREALSRLRHVDPMALGWKVEFHPGRDGYLGLADQDAKTIHIWVRDHHTVQQVLGTLAHETAHIYDYTRWGSEVRQGWLDQRGLAIEWWPSCTCDDRGYGAGDIAEALVMLEAGAGQWDGRFGQPTQAQLTWLASVL